MKPREAASYGLAGALLAAAPLAAFLHNNGYPLVSPEAGVLLAACLGAGTLVSLAAPLGGALAALVLGAAAALCIDFTYGAQLSKPTLLVVALVCLALSALMRRHIAFVLAVSSFVFLVSTVTIPSTVADDAVPAERGAGKPRAAKAPPVVLHLILDEHIGLDGLPKEIPETARLERLLSDAYLKAGFRLYAGAYSEYNDTRNSLPNLLNFTSHEDPWSQLVEGRWKPYVLADSAYFRQLAALGYQLHLYQSDYMDLCRVPGVPYAKCMRYRANSIGSLHATALDSADRLQFIVNSFLETSTYLVTLRAAYGDLRKSLPRLPLPAWEVGVSRVGPLAVLPVFERLERDLRTASNGEAYIAHLLIPHFPYMLDESCRPRAKIEHWLYHVPAESAGNSAASRAQRYRHYAEQILCQQALLERLFTAMKEARVWDDAIVIVHGDHGSRIYRNQPTARNAARLTREDFNDGFSTLFAVRKAAVPAGVTRGARPLQELLAETFGVPMQRLSPKVYLRTENDKPFSSRKLDEFH